MFLSTYVPVDMHRVNCAIYSAEKIFPEERLLFAYELITSGRANGVYMKDDCVMFIDDDKTRWTLAEIYLAHEAYAQAKRSSFSYYTARDVNGIPQLFISKSFRGHRLIVNAFSMRTLLLSNGKLVAKAASLIDKTIGSRDAVDLFNSMSAIESGSAKFLPAVIAYRGTVDEYMAVSPVMTPTAEIGTIYGSEDMEGIKAALGEDADDENGMYKLTESGELKRVDIESMPPIPVDVARYLIEVYDKMLTKKSNYIELRNENYMPEMYFSTNQRYLVNARTFECVVIKNQYMKALLTACSKQDTISSGQLYMIWSLAKSE